MAARFGQAFWPGVTGFISCSYTVSHDVGAGVATLEIPEQDVRAIQSFGNLVITDGFGTVRLNRCRVADIGFGFSPSGGRTITLSIVDRRWQWRYGSISGNWNQLEKNIDTSELPPGDYTFAGGPYAAGTYRPAHLMMADCLALMGELNPPLIAPAPTVPVPAQWDDEVPASALSALANTLGYRLVYQPVADRVLLAPAGVGNVLPANLPTVSGSASLDLPERPSTIVLSGGPTLYHDWLRLEPVGFEKSAGQFRPIDKLSYKPPNGWGRCNAQSMWEAQATPHLTAEEARELASRFVWRAFRVKMADAEDPDLEGPNVGGYGRVYDRDQIVLGPSVYYQQKDLAGQRLTVPAEAVGRVYAAVGSGKFVGSSLSALAHTDRANVLPWRPSIDAANQIVTFERQMFELAADGTKSAPDLLLFTGFQIRSFNGRVPERWRYGGTLAGLVELGCPPEVLKHPEMVRLVRCVRGLEKMDVRATDDNSDELRPLSEYYLDAANAKYEIGAAATRTYAGVVPLDPDGAISQVTWSVGGGQPATTTASRNSEHASYLPPFPERRRNEDLRRFIGKAVKAERADSAPAESRPYPRTQPPGGPGP